MGTSYGILCRPLHRPRSALRTRSILILLGVFLGASLPAQTVDHLTVRQRGGMPGLPIMTGITQGSNNVTVTWDGPSGYYQLLQSLRLDNADWQPAAPPSLSRISRKATVVTTQSNLFFRVAGPSPQYAGASACAECHENIHQSEMNTRHAHALETLKAMNQASNPNCLPCHTVGFGLPTGFISEAATPQLGGVQCENCHGPAGNHAANEFDLTVRPRVEIAATVCGGCHTGAKVPHYDEWAASGHGEVTRPDMNPTSCGRCHIGSARLAFLKNEPIPQDDTEISQVCVVCHDPHASHVRTNIISGLVTTNQVRNPLASLDDYFLTTSDVFSNKYNPEINICAQCHNHRGATWDSTSRPPHHSPQYNMLISSVGELAPGFSPKPPASHATLLDKQCVSCHMQMSEFEDEEHPAVTGHHFEVESYNVCISCHGPLPEMGVVLTQNYVSNLLHGVKLNLDLWATTKAPQALRDKYQERAWEYTNAGELSDGGAGPSSSEQAMIPDGIKKARFDLYLVLYDGTYGVHNGRHSINLIQSADYWVNEELNK